MASTRYPQRVRNELRFRELTVLRLERISAGFQRIVLGGEALDGFTSLGFDDHTKVFFPEPGCRFTPPTVTEEGIIWGEGVRPVSRDYTPLYDEARRALALKRAVVAGVLEQSLLFDMDNFIHYRVKKVAIVGDQNQGARIALQPFFQPDNGIQIEVVGRFVEQQ